MPLPSSATMTLQSLKITLAMKGRYSASVWSIGKKVSRRNDAQYTAAIGPASLAVAPRRVKGMFGIGRGLNSLARGPI